MNVRLDVPSEVFTARLQMFTIDEIIRTIADILTVKPPVNLKVHLRFF
jgi:hypothetical protein